MRVLSTGSAGACLDWRMLDRSLAEGILDAIPQTAIAKTASSGKDGRASLAGHSAAKEFFRALKAMSVGTGLSADQILEFAKTASEPVEEEPREETIRIASKNIKDSHYFMDVSIDPVSKMDKTSRQERSLVMVSFFMREGYLGRYMIKRNFFYTPSNAAEARATYEELVRKARRVKSRYLSGKSEPYDLMPEVKSFLDGIRGDFESIEEDHVGTNFNRDRESYHETAGTPHIRQA